MGFWKHRRVVALLVSGLILAFHLAAWSSLGVQHLPMATVAVTTYSIVHSYLNAKSEPVDAYRFALYRILGNDMPPLQSVGQLRKNVEFTLQNELNLRGCQKRWVLNNILNSTEEEILTLLLHKYGVLDDDIIVRRLELDKLGDLDTSEWEPQVTALNLAKNAAIEDGVRRGARWILAFDGNHFITNQAWEQIMTSADKAERDGHRYLKVPAYRLMEQQSPAWLHGGTTFTAIHHHAPLQGESQLGFRNDSVRRLDPNLGYGQRNKWNFLVDVCGVHTGGEPVACGCADVYEETVECNADPAPDVNRWITEQCGYSLRLWFYPPAGVDGRMAVERVDYRQELREQARERVIETVRRKMEDRGWMAATG